MMMVLKKLYSKGRMKGNRAFFENRMFKIDSDMHLWYAIVEDMSAKINVKML